MSESPVAGLSYASRIHARPQVALYRIAMACAVVPQAVGLSTLALYAYGRWDALPLVGLLTLGVGLVLLVVGVVCLLTFQYGLHRCDPAVAAEWRRPAKWTGGLLLLGLPVAFLCAAAGIYLMSQYVVVVRNTSASPVSSISLTSPDDSAWIKTLRPGETRRAYLDIEQDGEIAFSATQNGVVVSGTVEGYVTPSLAGRATLTFTPSGPVVRN